MTKERVPFLLSSRKKRINILNLLAAKGQPKTTLGHSD